MSTIACRADGKLAPTLHLALARGTPTFARLGSSTSIAILPLLDDTCIAHTKPIVEKVRFQQGRGRLSSLPSPMEPPADD